MLLAASSAAARPPFRLSLDGTWLFTSDPARKGVDEGWHATTWDRSAWSPVSTPEFWESYPGAATYDGWGWFARDFDLPEGVGPLSIHFAGVDDDAAVWVNGRAAGSHTGYSDPFVLDLDGLARPGKNTVVVQVMDHGAGGGIYRPVTLISTAHVDSLLRSPYADRPARQSASWVRDAVIYEVYLRSFSREGTFAGLEKRLRELRELGVTVLWLMPIHPVGMERRKGTLGSPYAVRDFRDVNPEFGTLEDFRRLVAATHREGMKIIIDLVANHTAWDNRLLTEHPDWYTRNDRGAVVPPNEDWTDVADLDYSKSALRSWMIDMMRWWVADVGIDGFRCDVAELVPTDFWEEARAVLDSVRPVMMLSEGSIPEHHVKAFDLTYAWNIYDVLPTLLDGRRPATILDDLLKTEGLQFPRGSLRMRFATNHDKNAWDAPAVTRYGMEGLRLATVLVFTLPGVPLIYTGEEVANDRKLDLFERVEVDWTRPRTMGKLLAALGSLRATHPSLAHGDMLRLVSAHPRDVYAFVRRAGEDASVVVLNFAAEERRTSVTVSPGTLPGSATAVSLRDAFTGERLHPAADGGGRLDLVLPPRGFRVFTSGAR